jgi:hypothetical protein
LFRGTRRNWPMQLRNNQRTDEEWASKGYVNDSLPRPEKLLCIKSEILGNSRSGFYLKTSSSKMNDAFMSRLLVYGYPASNPEIVSVLISSQFLDL